MASNTFYGELPFKVLPGYHAEIYACRKCKTIFTRPVNSREELDGFSGELFASKAGKVLGEGGETRRQTAISLYAGLKKSLHRGGDTLDIGSGFGDWLQILHAKNLYESYYGIEPFPRDGKNDQRGARGRVFLMRPPRTSGKSSAARNSI